MEYVMEHGLLYGPICKTLSWLVDQQAAAWTSRLPGLHLLICTVPAYDADARITAAKTSSTCESGASYVAALPSMQQSKPCYPAARHPQH